MRINTSHKSLDVNDFHLTDELLCRALRDTFSTLQPPESVDYTSVVHWRKTLPLIRNNESLKSLQWRCIGPSCLNSLFQYVHHLEGNATLESLVIKSGDISPDAYCAAVESLQPSSSLKTLQLSHEIKERGRHNLVVSFVQNYDEASLLD
jgi:hypothetical protein